MNQIITFKSGSNRLFGVCTADPKQEIKAGIIFVHAAESNRLGPHRMFAEMAERLKEKGIASFRFDMRGCGDSEGEPAGKDLKQDIEDLSNAIVFFTAKYNLPKLFLFGISRGARACLSSLAEHNLPVHGAVLLSTPLAGSKAASKKFLDRLKEYFYKLSNPESLKKFLSGKANFRQIVKTLIFALNSGKQYSQSHNGFSTAGCQLFFIYGSKDPITTDGISYYSRLCQKYNVPYTMTEIENANHSFFHYHWKEQIFGMAENWLIKQNRTGDEYARLS